MSNIKQSISIIIATYQAQDFIEECLDSVENQTYFKDNDNFEVLVGVDGCQDTLNKLLEIRHKYRNLSIFMMEKNVGTYIVFNTLLDLIKYENIIIFGADDVMMPEMINEITYNVKKYNVIRFKYHKIVNNEIEKEIYDKYPHGAAYFKRSLFNILGGYKPWRCAADTELLMRGKHKINEFLINKSLFYRRIHNNSLISRIDTGFGSNLRNEYKKQIREYGVNEKIKIKKIVTKYKIL